MSAKVSKRSVRYRTQPYRYGQRRCGNCSMFRRHGSGGNGSCTLVLGSIKSVDVCDRWEAKT